MSERTFVVGDVGEAEEIVLLRSESTLDISSLF